MRIINIGTDLGCDRCNRSPLNALARAHRTRTEALCRNHTYRRPRMRSAFGESASRIQLRELPMSRPESYPLRCPWLDLIRAELWAANKTASAGSGFGLTTTTRAPAWTVPVLPGASRPQCRLRASAASVRPRSQSRPVPFPSFELIDARSLQDSLLFSL